MICAVEHRLKKRASFPFTRPLIGELRNIRSLFLLLVCYRKTAITTRILQLVHQLCKKGIHVTKRDLFYTDVKLFQEQGQSDTTLDDVSCMLGCTRSSLNGKICGCASSKFQKGQHFLFIVLACKRICRKTQRSF
jgi:DNA topoisomerase VI subunit A